ncbi:nucleotide-binding universal stress UspA family protein [Spinactinospora alkalitolerans]|uniref:Nucleotide-binding universal stress UspA family protein n=1 Tax=Spinactinospora alkalitolerans TaxID=687207 RepID=A0A852TWP3_9ACTN|nr:universal stress protein [Spinactinospora alkalitolerans]NYE48429.1 nucleotide-binding universal stress UspA family protein [Spinactinospora alkalitolerans]
MRIAVAIDAANGAARAVRTALEEARAHGEAAIDVIYVYRASEPLAAFPSYPQKGRDQVDPKVAEQRATEALEAWLDGLDVDFGGIEVRRIVTGASNPARALVERSGDYDLLCLGARRTGAFRDLRPTVVSEQVVRNAQCSVLISRGRDA